MAWLKCSLASFCAFSLAVFAFAFFTSGCSSDSYDSAYVGNNFLGSGIGSFSTSFIRQIPMLLWSIANYFLSGSWSLGQKAIARLYLFMAPCMSPALNNSVPSSFIFKASLIYIGWTTRSYYLHLLLALQCRAGVLTLQYSLWSLRSNRALNDLSQTIKGPLISPCFSFN